MKTAKEDRISLDASRTHSNAGTRSHDASLPFEVVVRLATVVIATTMESVVVENIGLSVVECVLPSTAASVTSSAGVAGSASGVVCATGAVV